MLPRSFRNFRVKKTGGFRCCRNGCHVRSLTSEIAGNYYKSMKSKRSNYLSVTYKPRCGRYPGRARTLYFLIASEVSSTRIVRKPSFGFGCG